MSEGMQLPELDSKVLFDEWSFLFKVYICIAAGDAPEAVNMVEEERVWHSGAKAGIQEQFPNTAFVSGCWYIPPEEKTYSRSRWWRTAKDSRLFWKNVQQRAPRTVARAVRLVGLAASPP